MDTQEAKAALKKFFGYDSFRPMQAEIIETVFQKKNSVVLMPTGGGKSICYQIPAVMLDGVTLVISPLIALMKDQVEGLRGNGIPAAFINSSQGYEEIRDIEDKLLSGHLKILYVSPEKIVSQSFQPLLKRLKINLFAVDEAHCISAWGHDFRPEYTQLKFLRQQFPDAPMMALTATADKLTRKDIVQQLQLGEPEIFISSFDRPNLSLMVKPGQKRFEQILDFLKQHPKQSGIIYCLARKTCETIAEKLMSKGYKTAFYHAQIPPKERAKVQEDFITDRTPIIVATIAFGMGIDKSNVRFVVHYNMPKNVESYYQEIGRAGRDGLPADTALFYSFADLTSYRDMIMESEADETQKNLKMAKLNRMFEFAETPVCRRKTILNYFNEDYDKNCGNCDVCLNPPKQFDGTVAAQKALSAMKRLGEKVGMNMLIDVLRGSGRREIYQNGYHEIKTYGAGKEFSNDDWIFLISQMIHVGLIEIAYDEHNVLKVTPSGNAVLFDGRKVTLAMPQTRIEKEQKKVEQEARLRPKSQTQSLKEVLFDRLVALRRIVAQQQGVPPYLIFSDATLQDMAEKRPYTDADLMQVTGVGERKLQLYGNEFIGEIRKFILEKTGDGQSVQASTYLQTWDLFGQGKSIQEIAETRGVHPITVLSHLATMYEKGEILDINEYILPEELDIIQGALTLFEEPYQLKLIFDHFEQRYDYAKIKWALADVNRKKGKAQKELVEEDSF